MSARRAVNKKSVWPIVSNLRIIWSATVGRLHLTLNYLAILLFLVCGKAVIKFLITNGLA